MITIQIGSCLDDPRMLHKSFTVVAERSAVDIHEPCDIMQPVLIMEYAAAYLGCNYVYIPAWGRYYYITDMTAMQGGRVELALQEDVLMSFVSDIADIECALSKQEQFEGVATLFYKDPDTIPRQDTVTFTQLFSDVPTWDYTHVYLTTVG